MCVAVEWPPRTRDGPARGHAMVRSQSLVEAWTSVSRGGGLLAGLVLQGSLNSGPARPHVGQAQQKVCCCCCMYSPAWLAG